MDINNVFKYFNENANTADYIRICQQKGLSGCIEYIQQITGDCKKSCVYKQKIFLDMN